MAFMADVPIVRPERSTLSSDGRVVVPASIRKTLGLEPGVSLTFRLDGEDIIMTTRAAAMRKVQKMFRDARGLEGRSLVDELIAERRAEAARENAE
jgi:AbrB family looped-hinge helix DNA binding protein